MNKERRPAGQVGSQEDAEDQIDRSKLDNKFERWYRDIPAREKEGEEVEYMGR